MSALPNANQKMLEAKLKKIGVKKHASPDPAKILASALFALLFLLLIFMSFLIYTNKISFTSSSTSSTNPHVQRILTATPSQAKNCIVSGCNNEICAEEEMPSICIYKPEFSCFKSAVCERQPSGECGWTETDEYKQCFSNLPEEI